MGTSYIIRWAPQLHGTLLALRLYLIYFGVVVVVIAAVVFVNP